MTARKIIFTILIISLYIAAFRQWAIWAEDDSYYVAYYALALWPVVWLAVSWIWRLRWQRTLALGLGTALVVAMWSQVAVDFPSDKVESSPLYGWLLMLGPFFLAFVVGLMLPEDGPLVAALTIALSDPALLPIRIRNSDAHVIGGWGMYPFPSWLSVEIGIIIAATAFGLACGFGGARVRGCLRKCKA